jgi:hypothetical protein
MTRATVISLCAMVLAGATSAAAQLVLPAEIGRTSVEEAQARSRTSTPVVLAQSQSQAPRVVPPRRRRGTFVGYVEDALVQSNLRIRFDAATGNTVPDRAEFFYAKCACYSGFPASNPAFDPNPPGPGPGAANDIKFQQLYLEGEVVVAPRLSLLAQVPLRFLQPQSFIPGTGGPFDNQSGLGDIRAGAKLAFVDSATTTATVKAQVYFPSGANDKGLGTDHFSFEPSVLMLNELSEKFSLESQFGVWLPIGGANPVPTNADGHFAGRLFYYGIGPSFTVYETTRTRLAPVVELVGWHVLDGNQTSATGSPDADGTNIVNLKIGARFFVDRGSFYAGYGHALTDAAWYTDVVRFEYRYSF